jgi:hypothetical protein
MATRHPDIVRLVPYEDLVGEPVAILTAILNHLAGRAEKWPTLADAVWLARSEHLKAIESEIRRSLDGTQTGTGSHIAQAATSLDDRVGTTTRSRVVAFLRERGIDPELFDWPAHQMKAVPSRPRPPS